MDNEENGINDKEGSKEERLESAKLDLDTFLAKEVGQFGRHQFRTVIIAALSILLCASHGTYVFVSERIKTRCLVPECETIPGSEFAPSWLSNAVPKSSNGFDGCHRFTPNISLVVNATNQCSPQAFDATTLMECEKYVYESNISLVYDFDLACDEWRRTLVGSAPSLVLLISLPIFGIISDIWGRKVALTFGAFNGAWIGCLMYWTTSYNAYVGIGMLATLFYGGVYPSAFILAVESAGPKYRVLCGTIIGFADSLGNAKIGFIAWAVEHWRSIILFVYAPALGFIFLWFFYSESLRWYVTKGRLNDAEKLLKDMANTNQKTLSENAFTNLKMIIEEEQIQKAIEEEDRKSDPCLPILIFRHKKILIRCMLTPILWLAFVVIYYSLEANSVYLPGNKYTSYITSALIELPSYFVALYTLNNMKRRVLLSGSYFVCAISQIAYVFTTHVSFAVSLLLFLVGKFTVCITIQAVYLFTIELYPTKYRHSLLAFSSTIGRIGNVIAPLTPALGNRVPFIIISVIASLAGILVFSLPETFNTVLPNTMEEASELKQKDKNQCSS